MMKSIARPLAATCFWVSLLLIFGAVTTQDDPVWAATGAYAAWIISIVTLAAYEEDRHESSNKS